MWPSGWVCKNEMEIVVCRDRARKWKDATSMHPLGWDGGAHGARLYLKGLPPKSLNLYFIIRN